MTAFELLLVLLLAGAAMYWIGLTVLCVRAVVMTPRLDAVEPGHMARWPRVSLVIPARDEAATLHDALSSKLRDDYTNLEFVVVNDRSTDKTARVVHELGKMDGRIRPVTVHRLPEEWIGKVHALSCGVEHATGEWLLFTDADVHFSPGTIRRAITLCEERDYDFLTVLPGLRSRGLWLDAVYAVALRAALFVIRPAAIEDPKSPHFAGSGVFNLVRREAFDRTPGFEWLRLEITDDVALAMMLKRSGARCGIANGRNWVELAWYDSVRAMAEGVEKNAYATLGRYSAARTTGLSAVFLLVELLPFAMLASVVWIPAAWVCLLALGSTVLVSRWLGRPLGAALLTPVGAVLLAWMMIRGAWLGRKRGGVLWRGTLYPTEQLRENQRLELP